VAHGGHFGFGCVFEQAVLGEEAGQVVEGVEVKDLTPLPLIIPEGGSFRSPQGASRRGKRRSLIITPIRVRSADMPITALIRV